MFKLALLLSLLSFSAPNPQKENLNRAKDISRERTFFSICRISDSDQYLLVKFLDSNYTYNKILVVKIIFENPKYYRFVLPNHSWLEIQKDSIFKIQVERLIRKGIEVW